MTEITIDNASIHSLLLVLGGASFYGVSIAAFRLFPSLGGWSIAFGLIALMAVVCAWESYVVLGDDSPSPQNYPKSYSRERTFQGCNITVKVVERTKEGIDHRHIVRDVIVTAVDNAGNEITQTESTAYAGKLPRYVFDSPLDDGRGVSAGEQTRHLLEDVYDDIVKYNATGAVGDTSGVDSALDAVLGVEQ